MALAVVSLLALTVLGLHLWSQARLRAAHEAREAELLDQVDFWRGHYTRVLAVRRPEHVRVVDARPPREREAL